MHREINGAAAPNLGARVVPLVGPGGEDLKLAGSRPSVPTATPGILDRQVGRVRLVVDRQQCQGVLAGHLAKRCQRRAIKRSAHHAPSDGYETLPRPLLATRL